MIINLFKFAAKSAFKLAGIITVMLLVLAVLLVGLVQSLTYLF